MSVANLLGSSNATPSTSRPSTQDLFILSLEEERVTFLKASISSISSGASVASNSIALMAKGKGPILEVIEISDFTNVATKVKKQKYLKAWAI